MIITTKYELKDGKILKDGHTMFLEDVVKDLNCLQRNAKARPQPLVILGMGEPDEKLLHALTEYADMQLQTCTNTDDTPSPESIIRNIALLPQQPLLLKRPEFKPENCAPFGKKQKIDWRRMERLNKKRKP